MTEDEFKRLGVGQLVMLHGSEAVYEVWQTDWDTMIAVLKKRRISKTSQRLPRIKVEKVKYTDIRSIDET